MESDPEILEASNRREPRCVALRAFLTPEATKWQYLHGVHDETLVAPEAYVLDSALMARPGNDEIQLDLFLDYATNVALYPKFQEYFRAARPPLLAVWGKNDPFFLPQSATIPLRKCGFTTQVILRSKHTIGKSRRPSWISSSAI